MGILSVTGFGEDTGERANGGGLAFTGLRWTRGEWIVVRKAGKESAQKTDFPLANTALAIASIGDNAETNWTCREWHQDVSSRRGGPVADGKNKIRTSTPI